MGAASRVSQFDPFQQTYLQFQNVKSIRVSKETASSETQGGFQVLTNNPTQFWQKAKRKQVLLLWWEWFIISGDLQSLHPWGNVPFESFIIKPSWAHRTTEVRWGSQSRLWGPAAPLQGIDRTSPSFQCLSRSHAYFPLACPVLCRKKLRERFICSFIYSFICAMNESTALLHVFYFVGVVLGTGDPRGLRGTHVLEEFIFY